MLVTFSIPLQVHPCRASVDAVLSWRPGRGPRSQPGNAARPSSAASQALLPPSRGGNAQGSSTTQMSDLRFAALTTLILVLGYLTALSVSSLDRVLAYVGSTGSTAISFILPGLFYYKISDPDSIHHQRLTKEDDDADFESESETDVEAGPSRSGLLGSTGSIRSATSNAAGDINRSLWRWRKKWRWDLEHVETGLLRKMALFLAGYGICVMIICLGMNTFSLVSH